MVAGGLLIISYTTRLIPSTSLTMRLAIFPSLPCGTKEKKGAFRRVKNTLREGAFVLMLACTASQFFLFRSYFLHKFMFA